MGAINRAIIGGSSKSSSVSVLAGGDIVGRQVTVQTGGLVAMHADGDIELQAGRTTSETDSATQSTTRKLLGGKTTTTTAETRYESLSQGSRIEGSEETKQQARRSIKELDTAINVIDKAPVLRDAAELGLLAADVATLGELAAAKTLTSSMVKELAFSRTGRVLSDEAAAKVANNFYADADGFAHTTVREFQPGTTVRAENVNAGQVVDRDGVPRVDDAKRANDQQTTEILGRPASYWGTSYPAWKEGTVVVDRTITQPETYRMVISADQKEAIDTAIRNGDMDSAVRRLGGGLPKIKLVQ